uniref:BTB domain-containing protein n=1 Tax=viral metagenome TaxID=1070528 RepID=A0A6C0C6V8_9ZZZZ
MDFNINDMVTLRINSAEYSLYKYIAEMLDIYNVIVDCDDKKMIDINWNISVVNVNRALHLINCCLYADVIENISDKFEIISFMRYLCVSNKIMKQTLERMFESAKYSFFKDCCDLAYDEVIEFIYDNCVSNNLSCWWVVDRYPKTMKINKERKCLIENVVLSNFPTKFKIKVLDQIVSAAIIFPNYSNDTSNCNDIQLIYDYFNLPTIIDFVYSATGKVYSYPGLLNNGIPIVLDKNTTKKDIIVKNIVNQLLR